VAVALQQKHCLLNDYRALALPMSNMMTASSPGILRAGMTVRRKHATAATCSADLRFWWRRRGVAATFAFLPHGSKSIVNNVTVFCHHITCAHHTYEL
jgi:hypothetical protein